MIYREFELPETARAAAICAWRVVLEPDDPPIIDHKIPPDGTTNLVVRVDPDRMVYPLLVGPTVAARAVPIFRGWSFAGLRLRPYAAEAITGMAPAAVVGQAVEKFPAQASLEVLFQGLGQLALGYGAFPMPADTTSCLDGFVASDAPVARAVNALHSSGGRGRIDQLAQQSGIGVRQFRRRFAAATGLTPKQFASVQRVRRALILSLRRQPWADVAHDAGFSDQPHLSRALSSTFGDSPSRIAGYIGTIRHEFLLSGDDRFLQDALHANE